MSHQQSQPPSGGRDLWDAVDALVDRAPGLADLASHRLELLAARHWRARGREVPAELVAAERRASIAVLTAPLLLERVRSSYDGELAQLKGMEVARRYPDPALRAFGDVDLLVGDAPAAQAALLEAGFKEVGDPRLYEDIHHLRPLRWRDLPLVIEIHSRPKWIDGVAFPVPTAALLRDCVPDAAGTMILPPAHHALILAAHSWAHEPLRRLRDLVDVAVMAEAAGRDEVAALSRAWGLERLWRTTIAAVDAVLFGGRRPWAIRLWAQNLEKVRERTVLENHLQRWLSDFSILPPTAAVARLPGTLRRELQPEGDEGWAAKMSRTIRAVRKARRRRSEHEDELARARGRR